MTAGPVWLVSYPKSGNTWLRLLLSNLLSEREQPADINDPGLAAHSLVNRLGIEEATLIDSFLLTATECDRIRPPLMDAVWREAQDHDVFIKLHDAYRRLADGTPVLGRPARAGIYIIRDPRDVAVSLAFHNGSRIEKAIRNILSTSARMGGDTPPHTQIAQPMLDWSGHIRSWREQRDVPLHILRYEDLLSDTKASFARVVTFLGLPAIPDALDRAIRFADFGELQRQESENGFRERHATSTAPFFRTGRAGDWKTMLSPEQAAAIEHAHGAMMSEYGYL